MQATLFDTFTRQEIILRPYQVAAREAVYEYLRTRTGNPCAVMPTASGKTPVIASICRDAVELWGGRVIVLAHVKELLQQAADKLQAICPGVPVGVFSAGLGRKDLRQPVIVAGIQSVYNRACDFDPFDIAIIDEAHLIPLDGDGMYRQFLTDSKVLNPRIRFVGFTATPYRLKSGTICTPDGLLNEVCYEIGVRELIADGYLSPLISNGGQAKIDVTNCRMRGGDFVQEYLEELADFEPLVRAACVEIAEHTHDRRACLIFATGVSHAKHITETLTGLGCECGLVTGDTPATERDRLTARLLNGDLRYLANVNVLTTGFDAPIIDCVALLRPTASAGLYYQMVGRGFRLHPGKPNCLVLDFGGNVVRHGPVDKIAVHEKTIGKGNGDAPAKECPACFALISAGYAACPECGYAFPPPEKQLHDSTATSADVLSGKVHDATYQVVPPIIYSVHKKRDADRDAPRTLKVEYLTTLGEYQTEWVCLEHVGFAGKKAANWWRDRTREPAPVCIEDAVEIARAGGLAEPTSITVRTISGDRYPRIVAYSLSELPPLIDDMPKVGSDELTDIPF